MAQMLEDLEVEAGQRVLEIGAGTGYNAALLAHVAGPGRVTSVEVDRDVLVAAERHLRNFAECDVRLLHADGRLALPDAAPFDRVLVTAAAVDLEPAWLEQSDGGRVVAPLALAPGLAVVATGRCAGRVLGTADAAGVLRAAAGEGESGSSPRRWASPDRCVCSRRRGRVVRWPDGSRAWPPFVRGLAFFGWLRGLRRLPRGGGTSCLRRGELGRRGLSAGAGPLARRRRRRRPRLGPAPRLP
jgi:SAM-dependent methyltransferase